MNYPESQLILDEIKKAKRILLNCHRSPDPDSVGSALAMRSVLVNMDKGVEIICPDNITTESKFLKFSETVQKVDYSTFDFSKFDLFIIMDSSEWFQVAGFGNEKIPEIKKIVIDHHYTNKGFGDINIIDSQRSSTGEVLYNLFLDWGLELTKETAEYLLAGIIYDTSLLQHSSADNKTAKAVAHLMELGADKNKIVSNFYRSISFGKIKLMGEVLKNMQIDLENRFVWSAIPNDVFTSYPDTSGIKSMAASLYAASVEGSDFGMIMIEEKKDFLNISFRAKEGSDISKIAQELGGGGHKQAGATVIRNLPFNEAVEKVLEVCRKYAQKTYSAI